MKVWGVTGWKNTGKTGLMERLVTEFTARGLGVSTIKHAHHGFDIDKPGTDSHRHRAAGSMETLIASSGRWALMHELRETEEPDLDTLLSYMSPVDLVLIEGYKDTPHPKIETHREAAGRDLIAPGNPSIKALASDVALAVDMPVFHLDDTVRIANFIARELGL